RAAAATSGTAGSVMASCSKSKTRRRTPCTSEKHRPQLGRMRRCLLFPPRFVACERRQLLDAISKLLARQPQLIEVLEVQPEFSAGTEPVREPQCRISSDAA